MNKGTIIPLVHSLHKQMDRLVAAGNKFTLERFLGSLSHNKELLKADRYDLILQARALTFDPIGIKTALHSMQHDGIRPGKIALRALLQYHVTTGDLEGAESLCLSLPKYGEDGLDAHMLTCILSGWAKLQMVERAERLFDKVPELHANCHVITAMVSVYYNAGQPSKAIELVYRLAIKMDTVLEKLVIKCWYAVDPEKGLREWGRASKRLPAMDWLEMAQLFANIHPENVFSMANEAINQFGVTKGVPELTSLAISSSDDSQKSLSLFNTILEKCSDGNIILLAKPLCALASHSKSSSELLDHARMIHNKYSKYFSHITNLELISKLN
jgi:hypothetical protein